MIEGHRPAPRGGNPPRRAGIRIVSAVVGSLAAFFYLLTGGWLGVRLARPGLARPNDHQATFGLVGLVALAVVLHSLTLAPAIFLADGVNLSFFNVLSLAGWLIAVLLLALMMIQPAENFNLGIVLLPFSAASVLLLVIFPDRQLLLNDSAGWPLRLHVVLSISAYALLTLAAVQALLLALAERRLRHRSLGGVTRRLPPLTALESQLFQLIGGGFALLSLALLSGLLFLQDIFAQHLVHKTVLALLAWLLFGVLLWGRWRFGWRGRTAVRWTLTGFAVLALAYFGSELVLQLILERR